MNNNHIISILRKHERHKFMDMRRPDRKHLRDETGVRRRLLYMLEECRKRFKEEIQTGEFGKNEKLYKAYEQLSREYGEMYGTTIPLFLV